MLQTNSTGLIVGRLVTIGAPVTVEATVEVVAGKAVVGTAVEGCVVVEDFGAVLAHAEIREMNRNWSKSFFAFVFLRLVDRPINFFLPQ